MKTPSLFVSGGLLLAVLTLGLPSAAQEPVGAELKKSQAPGQQNSDPRAKDRAALQQSAQAFREAFNQADAKAVAALWTEDGDYIDESGRRFAGRDAIEKEYARFFAEHPGAKITIVVDSLRIISDDAAIEDGRAVVEFGRLAAPGSSRYTVVHVKTDGKWLMSTVRDTSVETAPANNHLQEFQWLVGSWSAEEHGATLEAVCRWVAEKSFLERSYSVKRGELVVSSGIQIIGWNPQTERVQSWTFTSDGGHAMGAWTARENGWAVEMSGMLADGTPTSAVNLFTRIDDNAFTWQSVERTAGGVRLPDAEEVVLKRVTVSR